MRWLIPFAFVVAACSGGTKATGDDTTVDTGGGGGASGQQTAEAWKAAWESHDAATIGALYAHDLDVMVVDQGVAYRGWTAVETYLSTELGTATEIHLTLEDVIVTGLGSTGSVVTATLTKEMGDGVSVVKEKGALTLVLRATGDGWEIVSEHYSYPPSVD
jgi:ketosteroid isomerase-like protein